jgi:hypothetical protein
MAENAVTHATPSDVPATPPDAENEALLDASKTFMITAIGAVLFCLAALFIIMSTRMG